MPITPKQQEEIDELTRKMWSNLKGQIQHSPFLQSLLGLTVKESKEDGTDS